MGVTVEGKGKRLWAWLVEEMTKSNVSGLVSGWLGSASHLVQQKNATHPPTQRCSLCKASLLAGVACKTPWYVLVVWGLALPSTSSSLNRDRFHLQRQPKTTFHRSGRYKALKNNQRNNTIFKSFIDICSPEIKRAALPEARNHGKCILCGKSCL